MVDDCLMDVKKKGTVQCGSVSAGGSRCSQALLLAEEGKMPERSFQREL